MLLADLGAEVIKIEGHRRSDLTRRSFPWPLPEPEPLRVPANQGMSFNSVNMNKKSLTLDLSRQEGVALALKLAAKSDVVLDNMRPGVMTKMGLGYEALTRVRPDMVVLASSSRGLSGPETDYLGFATIHGGIGGIAYLSGYPDDHPTHGSAGDVDIMNAMTSAFAVVAALSLRRRTGQGQFIDYSQCEGVSSLIGEYLLGYAMTGRVPERTGNAHPRYAPHAVYRCWGVDRWLALEVHSDREFAALAKVIGRPELAQDPRFYTMEARKKNEAELDRILGDWMRQRDRDWMVGEFVKAGVMSAPSREARDLYADRHLRARGSIVGVEHPELGLLELIGPLWRMSGCQTPRRHAPLLGQHNRYVLGEILGLSDQEIEELRKKDLIL
jgi:benzylsuccinate CoA-transferase BbsF subunit